MWFLFIKAMKNVRQLVVSHFEILYDPLGPGFGTRSCHQPHDPIHIV